MNSKVFQLMQEKDDISASLFQKKKVSGLVKASAEISKGELFYSLN